jgi:medium-chain acyl-[acyl-carrier-protein] hydrolase
MYSLPDIVEAIAAELTLPDDLPFVMFGHSMGAIVAFEVARQLRREGREGPAALLVSGKVAPDLPGRAPRIAHFPPTEVLRVTGERYGGVPAAIMGDPELVELMGNCLKADLAIVEDYEPDGEAPLECPIVAIGGDDDAWVARNELDAWAQHTTGDFSSVQFRGGHFYFRTPDVQQALLALIRETCLKASNRSST